VGLDRGDNAALLAIEILGITDNKVANKIRAYRKEMESKILEDQKSMQL